VSVDLTPAAVVEQATAVRKTETPYVFDASQSVDIEGGIAFVGVSRKQPKNGAKPEPVIGIQEGRMQRVAPLHAVYAVLASGIIPAATIQSFADAAFDAEQARADAPDESDETPDA
jgi:hypothetical protein